MLKSRAVDLINHESSKVLPRDWLRKKEQIAVDVHSMNVMVVRASQRWQQEDRLLREILKDNLQEKVMRDALPSEKELPPNTSRTSSRTTTPRLSMSLHTSLIPVETTSVSL